MKNDGRPALPNVECLKPGVPGATLACDDVSGIIGGTLVGHYWLDGEGEIILEGTVEVGDTESFSRISRTLMNGDPYCHYGGEITADDVRVQFRAELWEVWKTVVTRAR